MTEHSFRIATSSERIGAAFIDASIVAVAIVFEWAMAYYITKPYYAVNEVPVATRAALVLLHSVPLIALLLLTFAEARLRSSPGKALLNLRVRGQRSSKRAMVKYAPIMLPWVVFVVLSADRPLGILSVVGLAVWSVGLFWLNVGLLLSSTRPFHEMVTNCKVISRAVARRGFEVQPYDHEHDAV